MLIERELMSDTFLEGTPVIDMKLQLLIVED